MPARKLKSKRKVYKTACVPARDFNLIKKWVDSGKSPYVSVDEAYRDAIRRILYGRWPEQVT